MEALYYEKTISTGEFRLRKLRRKNGKRNSGVNSASVNFITQRLILDAEDSHFDKIINEVIKLCKKIEPDCTIKI